MTTHTITLEPSIRSPHDARLFAQRVLDDSGCAVDAATIVLLVSELVSNAVLHGRGEVELAIDADDDAVRVHVTDGDSATVPQVRSPKPYDRTGRGMFLVDRLAQRWGVERIPGDGKRVWFVAATSAA
jgi:anti-sigma regulatory factor (Ser/Thr protein kinase)